MPETLLVLIRYPYALFKWFLPFEVYAYLMVGGFNTMLNIILFIITHQVVYDLKYGVELATIFAFVITVITGFWLNKHCVFEVKKSPGSPGGKQFFKYFLISFQGVFGSILLLRVCIDLLGLTPEISYFISTVIMLTINYMLQRIFTFGSKRISV